MSRWQHLETQRCLLRLPQVSDAAAIVRYYRDNQEHLRPFEPVRPDSFYTESWWREGIPYWQEEFRNDQTVRLLIFRRDDPSSVIGTANFTNVVRGVFQACTLGFGLSAAHEGQGLMRESLEVAIRYMFEERKLHRIMANHMPRNQRSGGLLKRLGFEVEGMARDYVRINGRWEDHVLMSKLNPAWEPDPSEP